MNIDDAIYRLSNCHPITKEDEEIFRCAVDCMKFTRDFVELGATPERMKHAINLLNAFEFMLNNKPEIRQALLLEIDKELLRYKNTKILSTINSRCHKCVWSNTCAQDRDNDNTCPRYKRDSPDGGYYG